MLLRAEDLLAEHRAAIAFLEGELARPHTGPSVVVTHHAPSARSLTPGYETHPLAPAFASSLERLMAGSRAPRAWWHGHVHGSVDYREGRTRVQANPRGYCPPGRRPENDDFEPSLLLEVA